MKRQALVFVGVATVVAGALIWAASQWRAGLRPFLAAVAAEQAHAMSSSEGKVRAPELNGAVAWLNVDKPLSLVALRGKVVLLDFWTYGCINCMHVIPDLKRLEAKYANELVVIGVHSAKFVNERETENIRRIIRRYEVEHPVANDAGFKIWNAYSVNAWPTQALIDPAGYYRGSVSGEGNYEVIDSAIEKLVEEFRRRGELNETPLKLALERAKTGDLPLAFPGKVLADGPGNRLFVADSSHNRLIVAKLDGTGAETIGTGEAGAAAGAFDVATFHRPQGMALDGDTLYVADTENHLIRKVDLKARHVARLAGTGRQSLAHPTRGPALQVGLNSPWDLQLAGRRLFIAMAGPHQIWMLDLESGTIGPYAGSGREARLDGNLQNSGFAQPSGITTDGKTLFVADSEANIIRAVDLPPGDKVRTLVGGDLFEFGDQDGRGDDVRVQHPLGVAYHDGTVFIADTYNHKVKKLDPKARFVQTFVGTGKPGQADGTHPSFYEPGGLSIVGDRLYIADTNNHAIRVVDLKTRQARTLTFPGLRAPAASVLLSADAAQAAEPNAEDIAVPSQRLRASAQGELVLNVALPEGYHLNPETIHRYRVSVEGSTGHLALPDGHAASRAARDLALPIAVPIRTAGPGQVTVQASLTIYYCRTDETGTCFIKTLRWKAPVEVVADQHAPTSVTLSGVAKVPAGS